MAWIKRNLFFVIGGILAIGLLGAAGFYNIQGWNHNSAAFNQLNEIYGTLRDLASKKPSAGNERVNNIEAAKAQDQQLQDWIRQAGNYFKPIAPVPVPVKGVVTSEEFSAALRRMIDQLQHEAENASVVLPPQYDFSFKAQRDLVRFAPGSLDPLAGQLGEVKTIAEILFAAGVNALDGIQRVRVSEDDSNGPQADYLNDQSITNNLTVLTPYEITFRSFSPEIGVVLAGFASSPHGFIVKGINVQLAGAGAEMSPNPRAPAPLPGAPLAPGRGGLQVMLNEQLLRVTLVVEVVKLLPKR
jgi:hypothetical protein